MNGQKFIKLVISMREAQRAYFASRKYADFNRAIALERQVDHLISIYKDELQKITPKQLELNFGSNCGSI